MKRAWLNPAKTSRHIVVYVLCLRMCVRVHECVTCSHRLVALSPMLSIGVTQLVA